MRKISPLFFIMLSIISSSIALVLYAEGSLSSEPEDIGPLVDCDDKSDIVDNFTDENVTDTLDCSDLGSQ